MNKKYLSVVLFSALMLGTVGTFTSCKDYDDDIENLQGQITTMKGTVDDLKQKIEGGLVVTSVAKTDNGVNITFSNGQTYELKNGADGKNGKDATVWSIGQDGYWYLDGVKTEYKAAGANGYYYKPNAETGCFDIYVIDENGKEKFVEATTISYVSAVEGVSVVHDGNKLIIKGAVDSQGNTTNVELNLGKELASVAFVPDFLDEYSKYPLAKFYHVDAFLDETKYVTTANDPAQYNFIPQTKLDKSSNEKLTFRVNPQGAYVEGAVLNFINRSIEQTKAIAGDKSDLLNVVSTNIGNEQIVVNASINASNRKAANENGAAAGAVKFDLAALQTSVGTGVPVTSDYIAVRSEVLTPILVDSVQTTAAATVTYYNRGKAITTGNPENHNFLLACGVPAVADVAGAKAIPAHLKFAYKDANGNAGKIDLRNKVGLYVGAGKYLTDYDINGMSYEFSLPAEYKDVDANNTNQQWFVKLNGSELSINTDNVTGTMTQAIGRRPIVRVDAFLTNNAGAKKLVASAYIRLEIAQRDPISIHNIELGAAKNFEYHALGATDTEVANMAWSRINNEIYGVEGLTATNFWNYYAANYEVKVITYHKTTGNEVVLLNNTAVPSGRAFVDNVSIPGISLEIDLNPNAGQTSVIKVGANHKAKTENTYKDMGNGAQYKVTITIKSNDTAQHGDFILTQVFNVKDDCKYYEFNPLYYFNSWNSVAGDYIVVKGKVDPTAGTWKLTSKLSEHFKMVGGNDIFTYCGTTTDPVKNVQARSLVFDWTETDVLPAPAAGITADATLELDHEMEVSEEIKNMNYEFTLVNGEKCKTAYKVVFVNPFVAGTPAAVTLHGNAIGAQNVATAPSVIVKDKANADIYKWDATASALALTTKATNDYQVAASAVTVTYTWVNDANFTSFKSQLTNPAQLVLNNTTGMVTWDNAGATLANSHNLKVKATVKFAGLSIVDVIIPVTITNTAN